MKKITQKSPSHCPCRPCRPWPAGIGNGRRFPGIRGIHVPSRAEARRISGSGGGGPTCRTSKWPSFVQTKTLSVLLWSSENMMFWVMFVVLLKYFKVSGYLKYLWPCPLTAEFGHKDTENKAFGVERQAASTLLPQLLRRSPSATCTQQHESTTRTASGILGPL